MFSSSQPQGNLKGKTVLITGASSGIGEATALHLALVGGANVVVTGRRLDRLTDLEARIRQAGGTALALRLDVAKAEDFGRAFQAAKLAFGRLDAVFANAAWGTSRGLPSEEDAIRLINTNYFGVRRALTHALRLFQEDKKGGVFVATSSIGSGFRRGQAGFGDYNATKAAVDALVRSGATFAAEGIRVYGINPGPFYSELMEMAVRNLKDCGVTTADDVAACCPLFTKCCFHPDPIGVLVRRLIAGGDDTPFPPGSCIAICGPAVFSMHEFLKEIELGTPVEVDLTKIYDPDLRPNPLTKDKVEEIIAAYKAARRQPGPSPEPAHPAPPSG